MDRWRNDVRKRAKTRDGESPLARTPKIAILHPTPDTISQGLGAFYDVGASASGALA